jgi:hypothetical protein
MIEVDVKEGVHTRGNMIIVEFDLPLSGYGYQRGKKFALVLNKLDLLQKIEPFPNP